MGDRNRQLAHICANDDVVSGGSGDDDAVFPLALGAIQRLVGLGDGVFEIGVAVETRQAEGGGDLGALTVTEIKRGMADQPAQMFAACVGLTEF